MSERAARTPFPFLGCWELQEMLGRRAYDERELLEHLEEVPLDSIYFHTHSVFLRERGLPGPYPNDFATWAAIQVRDRVLGEKLGIIDPQDLSDLESLRTEVVSLIDDHLSQLGAVPRVIFGEPFYFMQSRVLEVPTGVKVRTLREFRDVLSTVDSSVVYLHVVEARGRKGRRRHDFATWVDEQLGLPELAAAMARLNPFPFGVEEVRRRLVALCDAVLTAGA
ncbi:MAG: hypothetical protein E6J71_11290 [Deltaproteobacteria bacterium]|nr:MAG: hypothetical protein E6J81_09420 [Deltaproteobacteria bacterium]TMA54898.1 MAG: hypothetical protein E6J76_00600 [Deltaproteobacteria bacterium]TMB19238.1 MAG: hypothetical protein E6J71_11290 [Deltaproteobacteria bacterium]